MSEESDFGTLVCQTLAINPDIVRAIVIEVYPDSGLTVTLEIPANSEIARKWAQSEELKNPGKVVLMEIEKWQMD